MPADERAQMAAGQLLARLIWFRQVGLAADMLNRNRIGGGECLFQRFVELPVLASPRRDSGFVVHGGSVAGIGEGGE